MLYLIATAHVMGAVLAVVMHWVLIFLLASKIEERSRKNFMAEFAASLGIPIADLDNPQHERAIYKLCADRFSSELLRNRLSDLCGWVNNAWDWLGFLVQAGILLSVIWYTAVDGPKNAVNAWWLIAASIFFWLVSLAFYCACKLLTGRYPGQARKVRKLISDTLQKQQANTVSEVE